jgi:hypothetical protein
MKRQKTDVGAVVLGISVIFIVNGLNFPIGTLESRAQKPVISADTVDQNQTGLKKEPHNNQPGLPPSNDAEMVVKPDVPPNPEAVVTPPVVDPEMVVDPTTRQPITEEKLERLTPEELEKNPPGEKPGEFHNK